MPTMIDLTCDLCQSPFQRTKSEYGGSLKRGQSKFYCSPACAADGSKVPSPEASCLKCATTFTVKQGHKGQLYCSRKCSNQVLADSRRKPPKARRVCSTCSRRTTLPDRCRLCRADFRTLDEVGFKYGSASDRASIIRDHSRKNYLRSVEGTPECEFCGYTTHVQVCHIRPVKDFPPSATLAEVNHRSNLVGLCPNHHWELDHGFLLIQEGIVSRPKV